MFCISKEICLVTICIAGILQPASVQMPRRNCGGRKLPPPILPLVPMALMPVFYVNDSKDTTTTTTTTESPECNGMNKGIFVLPMPVAMPMPMPMPMPMNVLMPIPTQVWCNKRKNGKPPLKKKRKIRRRCPACLCAPSCTPNRFSYCSECHMKCRCRNRPDSDEESYEPASQQDSSESESM